MGNPHFFGINNRVFRYSHTMGYNATMGKGFSSPTDAAVERNGVIYVVNRAFEEAPVSLEGVRVCMLTMDEDFIGHFGSYGKGDGQFIWPTSIDLDSQDNVYVSDSWLNRIVIFDQDGKFLRKFSGTGSGEGELMRPLGLAFDSQDNLHVVDSDNHRVQIFTKEGKFLGQLGSFGSGDGQLNFPWGITIDGKGDVYIADWRNDRVQVFDSEGRFRGKFGSSGNLVGQFNHPTDVAVDQDGDIYVVDWFNHRVQVFTPDFRYICSFLGDATISRWGEERLRFHQDFEQDFERMPGLVWDWTPFQRFRYPIAVEADGG